HVIRHARVGGDVRHAIHAARHAVTRVAQNQPAHLVGRAGAGVRDDVRQLAASELEHGPIIPGIAPGAALILVPRATLPPPKELSSSIYLTPRRAASAAGGEVNITRIYLYRFMSTGKPHP